MKRQPAAPEATEESCGCIWGYHFTDPPPDQPKPVIISRYDHGPRIWIIMCKMHARVANHYHRIGEDAGLAKGLGHA